MDNKKLGHILFAITIVVIFSAFGAYAVFYRFASFMIRDSVQKTLIWSSLLDMQIKLQSGSTSLSRKIIATDATFRFIK